MVVRKLELAFKKAFNAIMFNWTCMMNNAYKRKPLRPYVHWHVRPRYDKEVEIFGKTFIDSEFGRHYDRERRDVLSDELLEKIVSQIKKHL